MGGGMTVVESNAGLSHAEVFYLLPEKVFGG